MTKRVGILTGGGDVPGLNMCLKSLVYRMVDLGFQPIGIRKGWEGLIHYNPDDPSTYSDHFIELTKNMVRPIDRTPGSYLHSSRIDPRKVHPSKIPDFLQQEGVLEQDLTDHIIDVFSRLEYRALVVIGDDDMLHYAAYLSEKGIPIIAIPKTIHNNINGTDYSLGFSTGLARGVEFIHELRALAGSREQIMVVETFAAKSGYSTLLMALLAGVDRVLIPEVDYDPEKLALLALQDKRETPANYSVIMVCDGARVVPEKTDNYANFLQKEGLIGEVSNTQAADFISAGNHIISSGLVAAELLSHITAQEVFIQPLTYLLRTGFPDGQDLLGATNFALTAGRLLYDGKYRRMTAFVKEKMWTDVAIEVTKEGVKTVDVEQWYDSDQYRPKLELIWSVETF
jgi:6-phosphofructokinase 1